MTPKTENENVTEKKQEQKKESITNGFFTKTAEVGKGVWKNLTSPTFVLSVLGVLGIGYGSYKGATYLYGKFGKNEDALPMDDVSRLTGKKANIFNK